MMKQIKIYQHRTRDIAIGIGVSGFLIGNLFGQTTSPIIGGRIPNLSVDEIAAGTQASGMGQAVTGYIKGADAIYYNPAGMSYLRKMEITTAFTTGISLTDVREDSANNNVKSYKTQNPKFNGAINQFATAIPLHVGKDRQVTMVFAYGYRQLRQWAAGFTDVEEINNNNPNIAPPKFEYEYKSEGNPSLNTFGFAMKSFKGFSFGVTYNVLSGSNTQTFTTSVSGIPFSSSTNNIITSRTTKLTGNYTEFGMMFRPTDYVSVGLKLRMPYQLTVEENNSNAVSSQTYKIPNFFTIGLAAHPKENLTITLDYKNENWKAVKKIVDGNERDLSDSDLNRFVNNVSDLRMLHYGSLGVHAGVGIFGYRYKPFLNKDADGKEIATHTLSFGIMTKSHSKFKIAMEVEYLPEHTTRSVQNVKIKQQGVGFLLNMGFTIGGKGNVDEDI